METNLKGKRKGEGGKGEHEGKGRFGGNGQHGSKGAPKSTRKVQDVEKKSPRDKSSNGTCDNWRKRREHNRKKQRKCGMSLERSSVLRSGAIADDEQERQEEITEERGEKCEVREWSCWSEESESARAARRCEKKRGPGTRAKRKAGERREAVGQEECEALTAQGAHEVERRAQKAREQRSAQEERVSEVRAQEEQEREVKVEEEAKKAQEKSEKGEKRW